jgi:hypothetical protein
MQYTTREVNAAINAIVRNRWPEFDSMSPQQKISVSQATWYWLQPIFDKLANNATVADLRNDWELVRDIACNFIVLSVQQANPETQGLSSEFILSRIDSSEIDMQTQVFMDLGAMALDTALATKEISSLVENFDNLDVDLEIKKLIARES